MIHGGLLRWKWLINNIILALRKAKMVQHVSLFKPTFEEFTDRFRERAAIPSDRERYFCWKSYRGEDDKTYCRKIFRAPNIETFFIKTGEFVKTLNPRSNYLKGEFGLELAEQLEELSYDNEREENIEDPMPKGGHKNIDSFIDAIIKRAKTSDSFWFVEMEMIN